ncbi:hypothetical protein LKD70_03900 [Ruminococcus sp. CLA-AA-H200]|uniref:Uncharacterized protein n=1 Tax=Ruminococcus turbiniformis TaxID=2881258 RepID=A0ABS8FU45_9FIRM|nr:hypothetical protein [Ruminococcus turbiniformis]MCC2253587.1 hypothetical protein [Ruminococcus turbiniformis]
MFIEFRNDYDSKVYLVDNNDTNESSVQRGAWMWLDLSITDPMHTVHEYGEGKNMFLFEAAGRYAPAVTDIIHADTAEDAEKIILKKYGERLKRKTMIRKQGLKDVVDERGKY